MCEWVQGRGENAKGKVIERREREKERLWEREAENGMARSLWRLAGRERKVFTLSFCSSWRISRKPQMGKGKKQKDPFFRHLLKILQHWLIKKDCPQLLFDHYGRRRRSERLMKELLRRCFVFKSGWNKAKMWRCVSACACASACASACVCKCVCVRVQVCVQGEHNGPFISHQLSRGAAFIRCQVSSASSEVFPGTQRLVKE